MALRRLFRPAVLSAVGTFVTGIAASAAVCYQVWGTGGTSDTAASTPHLAGPTSEIHLDAPPDDGLPLCTSFHGTAPLVPNSVLWVAYRYEGNSDYFFRKPLRDPENPTYWRTSPTRLGNEQAAGKTYRVYAFYLDTVASSILDTERARDDNGENHAYHFHTTLPVGVKDEPLMTAKRSSDNQPCT